MNYRRLIFLPILLIVVSLSGWGSASAQTIPNCQFNNSDTDGDGFGWENRQTCLVTPDSALASNSGECIDEDGDGFGFDGERVCRVDANNCIDTYPIGDGWGWDGMASCQVTAFVAPFSELEILRRHKGSLVEFGVEVAAATLACQGSEFHTINLYSDGRVVYFLLNGGRYSGAWSTGFSDEDGVIKNRYGPGTSAVRRANLFLLPGAIRHEVINGESSNCEWSS